MVQYMYIVLFLPPRCYFVVFTKIWPALACLVLYIYKTMEVDYLHDKTKSNLGKLVNVYLATFCA